MKKYFKISIFIFINMLFLSACEKKIITIDNDIYSKIEKEDNDFKEKEELNENSVEFTNKTNVDNIKTKDIKEQEKIEDITAPGKISPKDIDNATIEEEYDCDIITIDGIDYFIPLLNGVNIANSSDVFLVEHLDGVTTLTTNDSNKTIIKIYMVKKETLNEEFFTSYLDNKFNDFLTKNTISNLKLTPKQEIIDFENLIYVQSLSWNNVENATITFNQNSICWMEYKDYYVYCEYYSYNEKETLTINDIATNIFGNFIYINNNDSVLTENLSNIKGE